MAFDNHTNLAYALVATAPSPATSGTSLVVTTGFGSTLGTPPFNMIVWATGTAPTNANAEIVRVTNISTDTLTITRAQEGTIARTVVIGDQIATTMTAKTFTDIENYFTGVTGSAQLTGPVGVNAAPSGTIPVYIFQSGAVTSDTVFIQNNTSLASGIILHVADDNNFAFSGSAIVAELVNGSDSGNVIQIKNAGSGNSLSLEDDAGNVQMFISKTGKLNITTGTNRSAGTGTLSGGTVTISTTAVTASSLIFLTDTTASLTNVGVLSISSKSAGTSFTVTSANVLDTSTFNWFIIN